jgi:hypothetical protein
MHFRPLSESIFDHFDQQLIPLNYSGGHLIQFCEASGPF